MKFSIITASYNQLSWLRTCILSVADQSFLQSGSFLIEHIIQDAQTEGIGTFFDEVTKELQELYGGRISDDSSSEGVLHFIANNGYHLKIVSEADYGMYDAINRGLVRSSGDICAWLNCDEQYLPKTLSVVSDWFDQHAETEIAFGDIIVNDAEGEYLCSRKSLPPTYYHTLVSGNLAFASAACFFRRSIPEKGLLIDTQWKIVGDAAWAATLIQKRIRMSRLPEYLAAFSFSGENLSFIQNATGERQKLKLLAPLPVQWFTPFVILIYRLRRLFYGAYHIPKMSYSIFTADSGKARKNISVDNPTSSWPSHE